MTHVQYITHYNAKYDYISGAEQALAGGCRWIQLRMKDIGDEDFCRIGTTLRTMCNHYHARMIIDDRVRLVHQLKADGVHLGKNDMPIDEARRLIDDHNIIIGGTANTFDDIVNLAHNGANYIGCGPYRFTTTKSNLAPILGIEGYQSIITQMRQADITLPIVAIGGITYEDVAPLMATGISGIAISGAILNAANPQEEMNRIINI